MALYLRLREHQSFYRRFARASGGLNILADFIFGTDDDLSGAFVFEKSGVLAGL